MTMGMTKAKKELIQQKINILN